jgi:triphosphoribosyl-dephospho-CoA synthase
MVRWTLSTTGEVQELVVQTAIVFNSFDSQDINPAHARLASVARQAMVAEAELTPKPGLVDRRGPGAHSDMSLDLMKRSAEVIEPFFAQIAGAAATNPMGVSLREELGRIGREAERAMYAATGGVNTHKGAIWVLGLLIAAASRSTVLRPQALAEAAGAIARIPDVARPNLASHGDTVRFRYGVEGARGEARANFPHVVNVGIPALRKARAAGSSETASRISALLSIMAELDDTCVLHRAGHRGARKVKSCATMVLAAGGPGTNDGDAAVWRMDRLLRKERISPGGSADLLAASLFLDWLDSGRDVLQKDRSNEEVSIGNN